MHDHNPDLIGSLAEGSLGEVEAGAAAESIAGCEECLAELAAQRLALAAIAAAPRPGLSMAESADLRRTVADAVGLSPAPQAQRSRRPWLGLATAAAVVVALIAVAPVVNLLSTGSDAGTAAETTIGDATRDLSLGSSEGAPATTPPPATEAPTAEAPVAGGDITAAAEEGEGGALDSRDGMLPDYFLDFGGVDELDEFLAEVPQGISDRTSSRSLTEDEILYYSNRYSVELSETASALLGCSTAGALATVAEGEYVITIGTARFGELEFIVALVATADGGEVAVAIDTTTCEVVAQVDV
jgi:hypothetical protein